MLIHDLPRVIFAAIEGRFSPENLPNNLALVELLKKWSIQKKAALGQISLAWLLAQKPWVVPIPGTTQMAHMLENTAATEVKFSATELQEFTKQLNAIEIKGQRLPDAVLVYSNVEAAIKK
jgi:aryl-alcohol dehydrogenase-like predicted oxidoreductase